MAACIFRVRRLRHSCDVSFHGRRVPHCLVALLLCTSSLQTCYTLGKQKSEGKQQTRPNSLPRRTEGEQSMLEGTDVPTVRKNREKSRTCLPGSFLHLFRMH